MAGKGRPPPAAAAPELPLEERITFLVHRIHSRIGLIGNRHFRAHDLNHYAARILVLLLQHEELRTGELVDLMVLPQSTISSQLQGLHAKRLVRRRRSRKDNRSVMVTLTPAGEALARDCDGLSLRVHTALLDGVPRAQARQGLAFLAKLHERLQELQAEEAPLVPFLGPGQLEKVGGKWSAAAASTSPEGAKS